MGILSGEGGGDSDSISTFHVLQSSFQLEVGKGVRDDALGCH